MKKIRQRSYTPWFQPDYERSCRPAELVTDFSRRHLTRLWQGIPSVERTKDGVLFAVWYSGGVTEGMDNFVLLSRKRPGSGWETPVLVVENVEGIRDFDPNVWIDPRGCLHLFWTQAHMFFDGREGVWEAVCEHPDDNHLVFSAPRRLADGVMLNKPTVLSSGRWLYTVARCPICRFQPSSVGTVIGLDANDPAVGAHVYASDDGGATLVPLGSVRFPGSDFYEHMLYERRDGSLRMFARARPELTESVSLDGGLTWSEPRGSGILNPCSRFFLRRMPSGRLVMIGHDNGVARDRLTAYLSEDDGESWPYRLPLDERLSVSYPDAAITPDGRLYIIYDRDRYGALEILMASVSEAEILAGRLTDEVSYLQRVIDNGGGPHPDAR